ncbi:MAG TPA: hypothetical protein VGQ85_06700, partial [Candidatus Limnocylindrales bacterium]|nr:hypothetical protein [Candidatus Limnocylindrales bacterium]
MRLRGSRRHVSHAHRITASRSAPSSTPSSPSKSASIPRRPFLAIIVVAGVALLAGRFVPGGAATTTLVDHGAESGASIVRGDPTASAA